jgi:hypothetical protein
MSPFRQAVFATYGMLFRVEPDGRIVSIPEASGPDRSTDTPHP